MYIFRWDLYVIDRDIMRRQKRLTYQDALGGAFALRTTAKRAHQRSAETRILPNLLTPLCFRLYEEYAFVCKRT